MVKERTDNVLLGCDSYFRERMESFLTTNIEAIEPSWEVDQVVKFLKKPRVAVLEREEEDGNSDYTSTTISEDEW